VDLSALNDALSDEPEAINASSSSSIASDDAASVEAKAKDIARKIVKRTRSWDVPRITSMTRMPVEGGEDGDGLAGKRRTDAYRQSSSSTLSSGGGATERPASTTTVTGYLPDNGKSAEDVFNEVIEDAGATDSTGRLASASTEELVETKHELEVLTAQQLKLQRRAEEWVTRMVLAKRQLPPDIMLLFFQQPQEIEEAIASRVREVVEHWETQ
jgi:HPt (histidine-containing phosphotransfer) domain-containing protein